MRVLQLGGTYVGAQEIIEGSIHRYLIERGHESRVLYAIGDSEDPNIVRYETRFDNLIRRGLTKIFGKNHRFAFLSTFHLIRKIEEYSPDIVHLHTIHHGYLDFVWLMNYLAKKKIPVVYTLHDMWPFTGGCYYYTDAACDGYKEGCEYCPKKSDLDCSRSKTKKHFNIKKDLFKRLESICFVAVSQWVYDEVMQSALKHYPQFVVWNAVDMPVVSNREFQTEKFRIIGVATAWTERKGLPRFFELADLLSDEFEILLIGNAEETIRQNAPDKIRFVGSVADRETLAKLYASADIHVSMSLEETFGMTFVEAALCGVKSIGFDSTAVAQVVAKVKGYLVKPDSVSAMAELLNRLKQDTQMCRLTQQEQNEIRRAFSAETMAEQYLEIYQKQL